MTKAELMKEPTGKLVVRDSRTGRFLEVRGADTLKASPLPLQKGIDLTKPIAKQVRGSSISKQRKLPSQG